FCDVVLERPQLAADARFRTNSARVAHRAELDRIIADRFAELDTPTARALLDRAGIANSRLSTVEDLLSHPVLAGRDRWRTVCTPGGEVQAMVPPVILEGTDARFGPVPAVGEHTDAVLAELGCRPDEIAALRARDII